MNTNHDFIVFLGYVDNKNIYYEKNKYIVYFTKRKQELKKKGKKFYIKVLMSILATYILKWLNNNINLHNIYYNTVIIILSTIVFSFIAFSLKNYLRGEQEGLTKENDLTILSLNTNEKKSYLNEFKKSVEKVILLFACLILTTIYSAIYYFISSNFVALFSYSFLIICIIVIGLKPIKSFTIVNKLVNNL